MMRAQTYATRMQSFPFSWGRSDPPLTTRFVSSSVFFMHATSCILPGSVSKRTAYKFAGGIVGPASVYIRGQLGGTR